jgi:hypothetical protein
MIGRLGESLRAVFHHQGGGQGTGLGLAQAYGFARQSGGTVQVDSRAWPRHGCDPFAARDRGATVTGSRQPGGSGRPDNPDARFGSSGGDDENVAALAADMVEQLAIV